MTSVGRRISRGVSMKYGGGVYRSVGEGFFRIGSWV